VKYDVFVALKGDTATLQALLSTCQPFGRLALNTLATPESPIPPKAASLLESVPSGTRMHIASQSSAVGIMTIAEGKLKGREVWACSDQYYMLHAWP